MNRSQILNKIKNLQSCDLLVIGGGATGCGIALDAASRGLSVVLVEQDDFAAGTSGRSSKLVHGGVRYLEMAVKRLDRAQYQLVREGLVERDYFLHNAPHLTRSLPLISPLYRWWRLPYLWVGLKLYQLLAGRHRLGPSGYVSAGQTLLDLPQLRKKGLKGGIRYYDGQFNDARMALSLALSAASQGALVANHLAVTEFQRQDDRLCGAVLEDRLSGERFEVRARAVVNAAGPFADRLRQLDRPAAEPLLMLSSGVHIVLDASYPPPPAGLLLSETEDRRVLFVLPWQGRCLVGTTDRPAELNEHPPVEEEDIAYLLRHLGKILDPPPRRNNIAASWSGLRPLVGNSSKKDSARLVRDFIIEESPSGLFSIVGGKWTSYRRMAEQLIDRVVARRGLSARPCRTRDLPVHGAENWQPEGWRQLVADYGLTAETARYLQRNYGSQAVAVARLAGQQLAAPLAVGQPCIEAEVVYACRHELAERLVDVLARRLPLALLDQQLAGQIAPRVLELMAREKGWDEKRCAVELQLLEERLREGL